MTTDPNDGHVSPPAAIEAAVAHDLKNALSVIEMSLASVVRSLPVDASTKILTEASRMRVAVRHMDSVLLDLLDRSALDAGRLTLDLERYGLREILTEPLLLFVPSAVKKSIVISEQHLGDDIVVLCDRRRVERVFTNVVSNAIKFTPAVGTIAISGERVRSGMVSIRVADWGPGIGDGDLENIFHRHWRGAASRGAGLGLSIARDILRAHGGGRRMTAKGERARGQAHTAEVKIKMHERGAK